MDIKHYWRQLSPLKVLITGYIILSLLGALLLSFPFSCASGKSTLFLDALFTSSSAITTTGLIVVDTGSHFNIFGQTIIMILFQIGGLGYMLYYVIALLVLGKKLSLRSSMLLRESLKRPITFDIIQFTKRIILYTFIIELLGAIFLSLYFLYYHQQLHPMKAVYSAVFHSISAFNTAGFSIYADNLSAYHSSLIFNGIIIGLFTLGAVGFYVLMDTRQFIIGKIKKERPNELSLHSKFVFLLTLILGSIGTVLLFSTEYWRSSHSIKEKWLPSLFQTLSALSTTGFNTIEIGRMADPGLTYLILAMFIGAGPGGTGGGIKITTCGVLLAWLYSCLKGRKDVSAFQRRVPDEIIRWAFAVALLASLWIFIATMVLMISENLPFLPVLFETASALGTVGLSMGITSGLSAAGKLIIITSMLIGRVGPLSVGLSLLADDKKITYQYPDGEIYIG